MPPLLAADTLIAAAIVIPSILTAIAAVLGVMWQGWKTRGELMKVSQDMEVTRAATAAVKAEVKPNGGGSMRDGVDRIEATLKCLKDGQDQLREANDQLRADGIRTHRQMLARIDRLERRGSGD